MLTEGKAKANTFREVVQFYKALEDTASIVGGNAKTCITDSEEDMSCCLLASDSNLSLISKLVSVVEQLCENRQQCFTISMDDEIIRYITHQYNSNSIRMIQHDG